MRYEDHGAFKVFQGVHKHFLGRKINEVRSSQIADTRSGGFTPDRQRLTCLKKTFPAIRRPQLHSLIINACFCARGNMFSWTGSLTPYSLTNHFLVEGSIRAILMAFPCFLQNSSKALSVTNVSTSFSCPAETSFCTSATSKPNNLAARFQEHGPSGKLCVRELVDPEGSTHSRFAQQAANEARVTRGSRTRSMPSATSCRKRVRLIRNNLRSER